MSYRYRSNTIPLMQYDLGGFFKKAGMHAGNILRGQADVALSVLGMGDVIQAEDYKGEVGKKFGNIIDKVGGVAEKIAPIAANVIAPGSGTILSGVQQGLGTLNPQDEVAQQISQQSNGVPINPTQRRYNTNVPTFKEGGTLTTNKDKENAFIPYNVKGKQIYQVVGSEANISKPNVYFAGKDPQGGNIYVTDLKPGESDLEFLPSPLKRDPLNPSAYRIPHPNTQFEDLFFGRNDGSFIQMENGGNLPVVQDYSGNSHMQGGIKIDKQGNPTAVTGAKAVAEVEGDEFKYKDFIFSNKITID